MISGCSVFFDREKRLLRDMSLRRLGQKAQMQNVAKFVEFVIR